MEVFTVKLIFWFIALGAAIGALIGRFIEWEGVSFYANVIWGMTAAVLSGSIAILFQLGDGILFSFLGTVAILFLVNVFHQHHREDVSGDSNRGVRLRTKY